MSVIDTLITDRTQADVDALKALLADGINPADHKGAYNASDLNRVGEAVNYLRERLRPLGIWTDASLRTDWAVTEIPTAGEMAKYLSAVRAIRAAVTDYRPRVRLPESMTALDYAGANQIEEILAAAETVIQHILLSFRGYSGRLRAGVNCLP